MSVVNLLLDADFEKYKGVGTSDWMGSVDVPNVLSYTQGNTFAYTRDTCLVLTKTAAGNCIAYQTINMGYNVVGQTFKVGAWVKMVVCGVGGGAQLSVFWLDAAGAQIGAEVVVDTITGVQSYSLRYNNAIVAPAGAYQIKFQFKLTGGAVNVAAYLDSCYVFNDKDFGLKVGDGINNSFLIPDVATILATGTVSLPEDLNTDSSYGTEIDLPLLADVPAENIGVICQVRDFDWAARLNVLAFDSGNKFWGCFFGDSDTTHYEKDKAGLLSAFVPGACTPGDINTWNALLSVGLVAGWDKKAIETSKVLLFASTFYHLLKTFSGTPAVTSLYARDYQVNVSNKIGYLMSDKEVSDSAIGAAYQIDGQYSAGWPAEGTSYGPNTAVDVYVVHNDGSEELLGSNVAMVDLGETYLRETLKAQSYSATWNCPAKALTNGDALKFVLRLSGKWFGSYNGYAFIQDFSTEIVFMTEQLSWVQLNASTWTITRYIWYESWWYEAYNRKACQTRIYWGTLSREFKIEGINYTPVSGTTKNVHSIGSKGVSEVDYMIYLKNYQGAH
jgi:ferredoxin